MYDREKSYLRMKQASYIDILCNLRQYLKLDCFCWEILRRISRSNSCPDCAHIWGEEPESTGRSLPPHFISLFFLSGSAECWGNCWSIGHWLTSVASVLALLGNISREILRWMSLWGESPLSRTVTECWKEETSHLCYCLLEPFR